MTELPITTPIPNKKPNEKVPEKDLSHNWLVNAQVFVDAKTAKHADFRGSFRVKEQTRIEALDVICGDCRRPYEDVADQPCSAKIDNQHLIGGDQRERAKRIVNKLPANAVIVPGPRINRYGIDAVIRKEL